MNQNSNKTLCKSMESRDHSELKNGVSPKDQMSRVNNLKSSTMKKNIVLIVGCFCFLVASVINFSCKKDKDDKDGSSKWTGCTCTVKYDDGDTETFKAPADELKDEGIKSCKAWESELKIEEDAKSVTCKDW